MMKSSVTSITGMKRDWDSFTIVSLTKFDIYQLFSLTFISMRMSFTGLKMMLEGKNWKNIKYLHNYY